jgi:CRP/FNR family transcriptional regulator, cyclic AMP receptor protein
MTTSTTGNSSRHSSALALSRLFGGVDNDTRQFVLNVAQPSFVKKGATLFERGDSGGTMYVVRAGRIEISIITELGRKIVLNQIPPGHCFGEIGMVDTFERTASAVAMENSELLTVSRVIFIEAVRKCPQLAINLMEILCERLRWVSDSVEEYALHALDLRVARRLLVLHQNFGDAEQGVQITQNELADFAGATRESTNKILMQWKHDGLVDVRRGKIVLLELKKLDHIAHGETKNM